MPNPQLTQPITTGVATDKWVPGKVFRQTQNARPVQKRRTCRDNRPYVSVPFTMPGPLVIQKYAPEWRADRDYWMARITAVVGRHDENLHPDDGTPSGHDITANVHRVNVDDSSDDQLILVSNSRLRIAADHHNDAVNDGEDGVYNEADFNIHRLAAGDQVYVEVTAIGTDRPGTGMVVTLVLVPIP